MEKAIDLNRVTTAKLPRPDEVSDGEIDVGDFHPLGGLEDFFVVDLTALPGDAIVASGGLVVEGNVWWFGVGIDVRERTTVSGVEIGLVVAGVATGARTGSNVSGVGLSVEKPAFRKARNW